MTTRARIVVATAWLLALPVLACGDSGGGTPTEDVSEPGGDDPGGTDDDADEGTPDTEDPGTGDIADDAGPDDPDGGPGPSDVPDPDDADDEPEPGLWATTSIGDAGELTALAIVSEDEMYAVGADRVVRWSGTIWAAYGRPSAEASLHGVWADETQVVVVGDGGFIARRLAGELEWVVETGDTDADLRAIDGRGPDDLWAAGADGTLLHYAGADEGWQPQLEGSNVSFEGLWVDKTTTGAEGVLAVGSLGTLVRWSGTTWAHQQLAQNDITLYAVLGIGELRVAVGSKGTITVRATAASTWKGETSNLTQDPPPDLRALAATATGVYTFGDGGALLKRDGTAWEIQTVSAPYHGAADLVAAGSNGDHLLALDRTGGGLEWSGTEWVDFETTPPDGLSALAVAPSGTRWAVGPGGLLLREAAQGWTMVPTGTSSDLEDVTVAADGEVWAVGLGGTILRWTEEEGVELQDVPLPTDLFSVAVMDDVLVIGGKGGTLLRREGHGALVPWAAGVTQDVRALEVGGDGALWLAGSFGKLARSEDGATLVDVPTGVGGSLNALAARGDGVVVAGDNGALITASGGDPVELDVLYEEPGLFLYGAAASDDALFAVGWNGTILHETAEGLEVEDGGVHALLQDVLLDGDDVLAVGRVGLILQRTEAP